MANVKKKEAKKVVISKIEITKSTPPPIKPVVEEKATVDARSLSLQQYHTDVHTIGREITKFALSKSENLLSVKMALMQAVREVERKLRENKREW